MQQTSCTIGINLSLYSKILEVEEKQKYKAKTFCKYHNIIGKLSLKVAPIFVILGDLRCYNTVKNEPEQERELEEE